MDRMCKIGTKHRSLCLKILIFRAKKIFSPLEDYQTHWGQFGDGNHMPKEIRGDVLSVKRKTRFILDLPQLVDYRWNRWVLEPMCDVTSGVEDCVFSSWCFFRVMTSFMNHDYFPNCLPVGYTTESLKYRVIYFSV